LIELQETDNKIKEQYNDIEELQTSH